MNRNYWNVYKKIGASFVADGTVPIPNEDMEDELESTTQFHDLVDGSEGIMSPETTIKPLPFQLTWKGIDATEIALHDKIKAYKQSADTIKIVTHVAGVEFIGKFLNLKRRWKSGYDDVYELEATFKPTEV